MKNKELSLADNVLVLKNPTRNLENKTTKRKIAMVIG